MGRLTEIARNVSNGASHDNVGAIAASDTTAASPLVPVFSTVVGEKIYLALGDGEIEVDENGLHRGCALYRLSEMRELIGCSAETVRLVHAVKKGIGGRIVGAE